MNFEDLQQAWQKQEVPELGDPKDINPGQSNILDRVKSLHRKVMISNSMMSVCLVLTCIFYVYLWREIAGTTIWFDLACYWFLQL